MSRPEAPPLLPELPPGMPAQGRWTYEDYCRIPDDGRRYEVIQGVLYVSPAPRTRHQLVISHLANALYNHVHAAGLGDVVTSPIDVILPGIATPVQPDILFVERSRAHVMQEKYLWGAPDLIVEVLSPNNPAHDKKRKLTAYQAAGVREYWIVDPDARTIEVRVLRDGAYALVGAFGVEDAVTSIVLPGLKVTVGRVCPES